MKHYILFDSPTDKGVELKAAQPDIGWLPDIEGFPALPFSVGCKLMLRGYAERDNRDVSLFGEFPTEQLFRRVWQQIIPNLLLSSDDIFEAVGLAADAAEDKNDLIAQAGDWEEVEGDVEGTEDELDRWVPCITRGDVFGSTPGKDSGLAAAELLYTMGPYMLTAHRDSETHFYMGSKILAKLHQSDADHNICDGAQLASEIAAGMAESAWPSLFVHVSEGSEADQDASSCGGPRHVELRNKVGYFDACNAGTGTTKYITKILPLAVKKKARAVGDGLVGGVGV